MPIKVKYDTDFGSTWYIKNDPDQFPHILVGLIILEKYVTKFILSYLGQNCEVFDYECSQEVNKDILDNKSEMDED
jgi:hypothetical protein